MPSPTLWTSHATILDLAKVEKPAQVPNSDGQMVALDSVSLLPVLKDGEARTRDPQTGVIICETVIPLKNHERQIALRNERYKLLNIKAEGEGAVCKYYDVTADPLEEFPISEKETAGAFAATCDPRTFPAMRVWHRLSDGASRVWRSRAPQLSYLAPPRDRLPALPV
ncbi:hypothetical protein AEB_P1111 [Altererythrobacter sp. B11]|uniref:hypothetical protein n=1 Tax=Altererythrobacter sp. B11 TaxID=2060312 RepID=UPI000DC6F500|nr:hypothetical protein [Altererythrobacter sp. B11]BBC71979.1 hypothetical protein AEB_P1111 [Altererythrobacter sp. B11]